MYASLFEALAAQPDVARSLAAHARALSDDDAVPARTKELIALMVAWLNACDYCTCVHESVARALGIDTATLESLADFARSGNFTEAERAALTAAVCLTREPRALPPNVWETLRANYNEAACVQIVAAIGFNNYVSRLSNALGVAFTQPAR